MKKIDCCMITVNLKTRLGLAGDCINSIEKFNDWFESKIISVDMLPGGEPISRFDKYKALGWNVLSKKVAPRAVWF